jgi:hypothetical protein
MPHYTPLGQFLAVMAIGLTLGWLMWRIGAWERSNFSYSPVPRFTLRDVFWCVTLVALGIAGMICLFSTRWHEAFWQPWSIFIASAAVIGSGLGMPVHRPLLVAFIVAAGAALGLTVYVLGDGAGRLHFIFD